MSADITYLVFIQKHSENDGPAYLRKGANNTVHETVTAWQAALSYGGERIETELEREAKRIRDSVVAGHIPKYGSK